MKRNADGSTSVVANLAEGLDNLAFDENDNLYVSSYTDGSSLIEGRLMAALRRFFRQASPIPEVLRFMATASQLLICSQSDP